MVRWTRNKKHRKSKSKGRSNRRVTSRVKNQKGGAPPVTSIAQWIENVKAHPAYTKLEDKYKPLESRQQASYRLGEYTMNDLKDLSLKLPNKPDNPSTTPEGYTRVEPEWDITLFAGTNQEEGPLDIRTMAANLYDKWRYFFDKNPSPTPAEFKEHINTFLSKDPAIVDQDQDFLVAANFMIESENKLRRGEAPIQGLTEDDTYPLLVWFLIMNQPDKSVQSAPSFIPKSEGKVEIQAVTEPSTEQVPSLLKEPET